MKKILPSFLSTKDKQAKALVVERLFAFTRIPVNEILEDYFNNTILLHKNSRAVFKRQHIEDIMNALKESCTALEFKVNQELFGHDPDKMFKTLLDFWMNHVASDLEGRLEVIMTWLCVDDPNIPSETQLAFNVCKASEHLTYADFYGIIAKLKDYRNEAVKSRN